jgi:hypothetical protein
MPKNILLIDKRVQDYETILAAVDTNICIPVLFDYYTDTVEDIKGRIATEAVAEAEAEAEAECVVSDTPPQRCVGLLQHNYNRPFYNLVATADTTPSNSIVSGVTDRDPDLETHSPLRDLIAWCHTTPGIECEYFDMMACALYSNPDWKYIIDTLSAQTGVTIRASTDDTGAASLGGDWFLESHTGVNLKTVYFTEAIEEYRGILFSKPWNVWEYSTKGFATGSVVAWGFSDYGGTTPGTVSSGVVAVYSNKFAFAALKTDGSVVAWGDSGNGGTTPGSGVSSGVVAVYSTGQAFAALKTDGSVVAWGNSSYGGTTSGTVSSGVVAVYSNEYTFAALKTDGSVVAWGD